MSPQQLVALARRRPDPTPAPDPPAPAPDPQPPAEAALAVTGLTVSYHGQPALRDVTLSCRAGEVLGIARPNGAGKTTLLKAVAGLVASHDGTIRVRGRPAARSRRDIAYVPQRRSIDDDYPAVVAEVAAMGTYAETLPWRRGSAGTRQRVEEALRRVGLSGLAGRRFGDLSGGQQQRALLARALVQRARLFLLDEPFAGVDATTEALLWEQVRDLAAQGAAVAVVHHDLSSVGARYDRMALLAGELVAVGAPDDVLAPGPLARAYGLPPEVAR